MKTKFNIRKHFGSSKKAMAFFGVTEMTISRWQRFGLPENRKFELMVRLPKLFPRKP